MERRHFLKVTLGLAAGAAVLAASAQARRYCRQPALRRMAGCRRDKNGPSSGHHRGKKRTISNPRSPLGWHRRHWGCVAVIGAGRRRWHRW